MTSTSEHRVTVDGRSLRAFSAGPVDADVLVFHTGTPSPPMQGDMVERFALAAGMRFITYQRPGYEGSDRSPGRPVAGAARDVEAILDHLGIETFATIGWSGGGQHALACAALLPARCRAAATIGTASPYDPTDESWWESMTAPNEAAFRAALAGENALRRHLEPARERFRTVTGAELAETLDALVSDVDRAAISADLAESLAGARRQAAATGFDGWTDDFLAFVAPWGFDPASIRIPVTIFHGEHDRFVPAGHARRLASRIPSASLQVLPEEGHISLVTRRFEAVLASVTSTP